MTEFFSHIPHLFRPQSSDFELRQSRAFLDSLVENLPDMVFVKDAESLKFVRFNKAGEELLGFSRKDLIGKSDYDFFPREQADYFIEKDRAVLRGGVIVDIPQEPIQTKYKGTRILHTKKIPLAGADGKITHLLGIAEDITERVKADEERLRISREEAALHEREMISKRTAVLAEVSTALASSLDYRETLKKIAELMVPNSADWCTVTIRKEDGSFDRVAAVHRDPGKKVLIDELMANCPAHGEKGKSTGHIVNSGKSMLTEVVTEEMLKNAAINPRHFEIMQGLGVYSCMVVPIPGRDKILGSIAFNVGESKRMYNEDDLALAEELGKRAGIAIDNAMLYETAQKASEMRDEFLSIASHELKTPLTSLSLQLQAAKRTALSGKEKLSEEKLAKTFDISLRQVHRLSALIEDLLDVSKIAAGKLNLHLEKMSLTSVVHEIAAQLDQARCEMKIDIQKDLEGNWDQSRIEQVLANFISNSIKYAAGKPIHLTVSEENRMAKITVKDFGPGISKENQQKIFERYERATQSRNISGLGLGLFIVKQIIQSHQGKVSVESTPGEGTLFTVLLPLSK